MSYYLAVSAGQIKQGDRVRIDGGLTGIVKRAALSPALPESEDGDYMPECMSLTIDNERGMIFGYEPYPFEKVERLTTTRRTK